MLWTVCMGCATGRPRTQESGTLLLMDCTLPMPTHMQANARQLEAEDIDNILQRAEVLAAPQEQ